MTEAVKVELSEEGKNLYIFFGGISSGIAMTPFEFYNSSKILDENKTFFRDFAQCWYQGGIPMVGHDIYGIARYIKSHVSDINPEKVYFVGNSMGGYAAILFSELFSEFPNMGEVIAFSPQTFISPILRIVYRDNRWNKQILMTYGKGLFKRKILNLRALLLRSNQDRKVSIFVSKSHRLDYLHASRLADIDGVTIFEFEKGGHSIVKLLRDQGKLPAILSGTYV